MGLMAGKSRLNMEGKVKEKTSSDETKTDLWLVKGGREGNEGIKSQKGKRNSIRIFAG